MMKKALLTILILLGINYSQAQPLNLNFAKQIGGTGYNWGYDMTQDPAGNIFLTGEFELTCDFDPGAGTHNVSASGSRDMFITKLTATGDFDWVITTSSNFFVTGTKIEMDPSGAFFYVSGGFSGTVDFDPGPGTVMYTGTGFDIFICKYTTNGNLVWAKVILGTTGQQNACRSIDLDNAGNIYLTGNFRGATDFDPGPGTYLLNAVTLNDMFITKLDTGGTLIWTKQIGDTTLSYNQIAVKNIALDASNNIYTVGTFSGDLDFNPGPGVFNLSGVVDAFILKTDASGNFIWAKQITGAAQDTISAVAIDQMDNIYVTGHFKETSDFDPGPGVYNLTTPSSFDWNVFIAKYNSSGGFLWAKHWDRQNGIAYDQSFSIALDQANNVAIGIQYSGPFDADPGPGSFILPHNCCADIGFIKLSSIGNFTWAGSVGGGNNDYPFSLEFDNSGGILSVGDFANGNGTPDFDPGMGIYNLPGFSLRTIYILKMNQCLNSSSTIAPSACNSYTSPSGNYTWTTSGTHMDTIPNTFGCDSVITINLTIFSLPIPNITGPPNACQGLSNVFNAGAGFTTYIWSTGATTQNIVVNTTGTYTVTVTNTIGCTGTDSISIIVYPAPTPVITGDSTLCPGQSTVLDPGAGYINYLWSTGTTTQVINASTFNTYTVTVTSPNGCTGSDSFTITAAPPYPTVLSASGPLGICRGDSVQLTAQSPMNNYQWHKNNSPISGATGSTFWASTTGNYKCLSTDLSNCPASSNQVRVAVVCFPPLPPSDKVMSIAPDAIIYPNPASADVIIQFNQKIEQPITIRVYSVSGKLVFEETNAYVVDQYVLSKQSPGYYLIELKIGEFKINKSLIAL